MRIIVYLCCLLVLTISHAVRASLISFDTRHLLIDYTKTKSSPVRSKSPYSKYALVRFIINDDSLTFGGNNSGSSVGIPNLTPTKADDDCTAEAYPYTTDMTVQNCASTAQCYDGSTYRMKCTACKGNMGLANGKCSCANAGYQYSDDSACPAPAEFDLSISDAICTEVDNRNKVVTYYKSCVCPDVYQYSCGEVGQKGVGTACSIEGNSPKYAECSCGSPYSLTCDTANFDPSGAACYDTLTKKNYYINCSPVCDVNKGQVRSLDDYWCDHIWVEFPNVKTFLQ